MGWMHTYKYLDRLCLQTVLHVLESGMFEEKLSEGGRNIEGIVGFVSSEV